MNNPHHSQGGPQQCTPSWLADHTQAEVLQALRGGVDKGGGEGGVFAPHHRIPGDHHAARGAPVRQLPKVGHHVGHCEGRVWVQGDGGDLKLLITQAGGVEGLEDRCGGVEERCKGTQEVGK